MLNEVTVNGSDLLVDYKDNYKNINNKQGDKINKSSEMYDDDNRELFDRVELEVLNGTKNLNI